MGYKVARVMSTQHPDNVKAPFFAEHEVLGGDDEVKEAFYCFSHLGCGEQLWDAEGKEVDNFVIKKLLTRYEPFFRKHPLGHDHYMSLRVPNPRIEKAEAKILIEALHSITRSHDLNTAFYGEDAPTPIPQVYVPMVQNAKDILRVKAYYDEHVIKAQDTKVHGISVRDWLGTFQPKSIRVTPLVEDKDAILNAHTIAKELIAAKAHNGDDFLRFWFARSDPALNYSSAANVLLLKIALQRLQKVQEESSIDILPLIGCGSAPFRGHFSPKNAATIMKHGYPSVQTFTAQSSFKYDHDIADVRAAIETINTTKRGKPIAVDEEKLLPIIDKLGSAYQKQIQLLAPLINRMAQHVPSRRLRKLHIGLFGYARESEGVTLPRAIKFTGACYSLGLPPELLGLHALNEKELDILRDNWPNLKVDHQAAAQYLNKKNLAFFPKQIQEDIKLVMQRFPAEAEHDHEKITGIILNNFKKEKFELVKEDIVRAGFVRGFLG